MGSIDLPQVEPMGNKSLEEYVRYLANVIAMQQEEIQNLLEGRISTNNVREIAGWLVSKNLLQSKDKDVGMSTEDTAADDIRFFSGPDGSLWLWYVTKSGEMVAQKATIKGHIDAESGTIGGFTITLDKLSGAGIIEGGTIRTAETGARIEIKNNSLLTYNAVELLQGLAWGTDTSSEAFGDAFFYINGEKALVLYNGIDGVAIFPLPGFNMRLGAAGTDSIGNGTWTFTNKIMGSIQHADTATSADYANKAGSADALVPDGGVSWFQVDKAGSDIADLETKNLSSLTQNSSYRTVTDTEKTNWNNAKTTADAALPKTGGTVTDKIEVTNGTYRVLMLPEGYFANNADNNETGETWNRLNTATGASLIGIDLGTGKPVVYYAPAGSNPITWNGPHEILTSETIKRGVGIPEGIVVAPVGTLYLRSDGGASSTLYVKESGSGSTGWVAK